MIKPMKIKCPFCTCEMELFLSINPTVIVLNCPECLTPLIYDKTETHILSEYEMNKIAAPSAQSVINSLFDKTTGKNRAMGYASSSKNIKPFLMKKSKADLSIKAPKAAPRKKITNDDIIDLRIDLAQCKDVQQFLKKL